MIAQPIRLAADTLRLPPFSREAEQSTLGSCLRDNQCIADVQALLPDPALFYTDAHQKLYEGIMALSGSGKPVDLVVLAEWLHEKHWMQDIGGAVYLAQLWDAAPTAANAEHYARIVRDRGLARRLIHAATEILRDAYDQTFTGDELLADAERKLLSVSAGSADTDVRLLYDYVKIALDQVEQRAAGKAVCGLAHGFIDLDKMTGGLHPGELTIVGARPSVGKSSLALAFARHVAVVAKEKQPVFFASLEMSGEDLAGRMLCMHARIDSHRWRTGKLTAQEWSDLSDHSEVVAAAPVHVSAKLHSLHQLLATARRLRQRHNIGLVIVDYLQLIDADQRGKQRYEIIGDITRRLKLLAGALEIPVVALAQLGRQTDDRADGEPILNDLRESGNIEMDADNVYFLYRPKSCPEESEITCKVAKQRNGPTGYIKLAFMKQFMRFENSAQGAPDGY